MNRFIISTMAVIGLGIVAWGVGGCGGTDSSVPVTDPGNFTGTYQVRDDNCNLPIAQSFLINDQNNTLTIKDGGSSGLREGDLFATTETTIDGLRAINAGDLGCAAALIPNEATADQVSTNTTLNAQSGDLLVVCNDDSADGNCAAIFARTSTDI